MHRWRNVCETVISNVRCVNESPRGNAIYYRVICKSIPKVVWQNLLGKIAWVNLNQISWDGKKLYESSRSEKHSSLWAVGLTTSEIEFKSSISLFFLSNSSRAVKQKRKTLNDWVRYHMNQLSWKWWNVSRGESYGWTMDLMALHLSLNAWLSTFEWEWKNRRRAVWNFDLS